MFTNANIFTLYKVPHVDFDYFMYFLEALSDVEDENEIMFAESSLLESELFDADVTPAFKDTINNIKPGEVFVLDNTARVGISKFIKHHRDLKSQELRKANSLIGATKVQLIALLFVSLVYLATI